MLAVQEYLHANSLDRLNEELAIKVVRHDTLPLAILNYSQLDSPKTHPIVRECRGLVLRTDNYEVVAKGFNRFFNWGEVQDEMGDFDFTDFTVQSKEDGSLILFYYFDGRWRVNTRGSFAQSPLDFQGFTWEEGICQAMGRDLEGVGLTLNPRFTFVCEFCSPWNKVVRKYKPSIYLLSVFDRETLDELTIDQCDGYAQAAGLLRPIVYSFNGIDEIQNFLQDQMSNDPTFEGVVMRDKHGHRWKIKSPTYLGLHRLRGEGGNLFNPKHLLPFVLAGEEDELLTYFPEASEAFYRTKSKVLSAYVSLVELWGDCHRIMDQKEFALAVSHHPFSGILFSVRKKHGVDQKAEHLKEDWKQAEQYIFKVLFK